MSGTSAPLSIPPKYLTLPEVAAGAHISVDTARRWAKSGRLPSRRLPGPTGKILIPREAVDALLSEGVQR